MHRSRSSQTRLRCYALRSSMRRSSSAVLSQPSSLSSPLRTPCPRVPPCIEMRACERPLRVWVSTSNPESAGKACVQRHGMFGVTMQASPLALVSWRASSSSLPSVCSGLPLCCRCAVLLAAARGHLAVTLFVCSFCKSAASAAAHRRSAVRCDTAAPDLQRVHDRTNTTVLGACRRR